LDTPKKVLGAPPKRGFAARKRVTSQDHYLLPLRDNGDIDPPLPMKESIETFVKCKHIDLHVHMLQMGDDLTYPAGMKSHFENLEKIYACIPIHFSIYILHGTSDLGLKIFLSRLICFRTCNHG
jgi:hypothetical protein